jgi:hypothetical protein
MRKRRDDISIQVLFLDTAGVEDAGDGIDTDTENALDRMLSSIQNLQNDVKKLGGGGQSRLSQVESISQYHADLGRRLGRRLGHRPRCRHKPSALHILVFSQSDMRSFLRMFVTVKVTIYNPLGL